MWVGNFNEIELEELNMKVIEPSYEIVNDAEYPNVLEKIERMHVFAISRRIR